MLDEKTRTMLNEVTRARIDMKYVDTILDKIDRFLDNNNEKDVQNDYAMGIQVGLLQAYVIITDTIIKALEEKNN